MACEECPNTVAVTATASIRRRVRFDFVFIENVSYENVVDEIPRSSALFAAPANQPNCWVAESIPDSYE